MSKIIGIDLGTSTSEVAILQDGKPLLIPNHLGEFITPSVINIASDETVTIGMVALEKYLLEPNNTVIEVKRLMGSGEQIRINGKFYSPEMISSYIIKYLVDCAATYIGEPVERAVITVPAYFSDRQRQSTMEAGRLAGITVERIINEPTAAALDYGLANINDCKNILVYDLGGGTLDVTVLEMFEGVIEVKASNGNNKLGGKDFDEAIINFLSEGFMAKHSIDPRKNIHNMVRLKTEATKCKIQLSTDDAYKVSLPFFETINGQAVSLEQEITRKMFVDLIKGKIGSTSEQIFNSLRDAELDKSDIDLVLLVGGSTRIPYVSKFVAETLHIIPQNLVDPDLAVVRGACIQGGIIDNKFSGENGLYIVDVCPYTLGTSTLVSCMSEKLCFDPIIPRNTSIPVTKEKIYYTASDYQRAVEVDVYQGEFRDPDKNNFLNSFMLEGVPPALAGEEKIKVEFSYDLNGILHVAAEIVSTGKSAKISIETTNFQMQEEIDITDWKNCKDAKRYRPLVRKAEKIIDEYEEDASEIADLVKLIKEGLVLEKSTDYLDELKDDLADMLEDFDEE